MEIEKGITLDILDTRGVPALSSTSDVPVVENKPDASPAVPDTSAAPSPDPEDGKTPAESATAEQPGDTPASDAPKKAQGVQKRLDELTKQREDEKRRALAAEERLDRALAALERATGKPAEEAKKAIDESDPEPVKPAKLGYDDLDAYEAALSEYVDQKAAWVARREVKAARAEDDKQRKDAEIAGEQQKARDAYRTRREKVKEKYADFEQVAESPDVTVSGVIAQAILHTEEGPELQYYFGRNPEEAKRVSALNPYHQLVELGKIAQRLNEPPAKPQVSAAPKPITPVRSTATVAKSPEEESMEEYAARRKAELAKAGRPGVRH